MRLTILLFFALLTINTNSQNLKSITPDQASIGESIIVSISGNNTQFQQGSLTMNLKQQQTILYPTLYNVINDTTFTANFNIPISTSLGYYDVNVNTNGNALTITGGFFIWFPAGIDNTKHEALLELGYISENSLNIVIKDKTVSKGDIIIYSVDGKVMKKFNLEMNKYKNSIDIADLPAGVYFLSMTTNKGNATNKFIKQ